MNPPMSSGQPVRPAPAVVEDHSVVDLRVLQEMVGSEPEVVLDFLRQYRESAHSLMAEIRAGHASTRLEQIGSATHKLKSSSRAIGAVGFGDLCAQLEAASTAQRFAEVADAVPALERAFAEVDAVILRRLGSQ